MSIKIEDSLNFVYSEKNPVLLKSPVSVNAIELLKKAELLKLFVGSKFSDLPNLWDLVKSIDSLNFVDSEKNHVLVNDVDPVNMFVGWNILDSENTKENVKSLVSEKKV